MTWVDYAVLGVIAVSVLWGVWRGLVREVISLAGWVIAFLAANLLAGPLAATLPASIESPQIRVLLAFVGVFIGALVVTTLAGIVLSRLAHAAGLGALDRALGGLFGVARALLVLAAFALLAGLTTLPSQAAWRSSIAGPLLARGALALKPWLPPAFAERLRYD